MTQHALPDNLSFPTNQTFIIKTIMTLSDKGDKKILIDTYASSQERNPIFAFDCHNVWFVNQIKLVIHLPIFVCPNMDCKSWSCTTTHMTTNTNAKGQKKAAKKRDDFSGCQAFKGGGRAFPALYVILSGGSSKWANFTVNVNVLNS